MKFELEIDDGLLESIDLTDKVRLMDSIHRVVEKQLQEFNKYNSLEIKMLFNRAYSPIKVIAIG